MILEKCKYVYKFQNEKENMTLLQEAFNKCAEQLQRIVNAYKRTIPTKVWRSDGTYDEYDIVGILTDGSIPNIGNVTKVEIGSKVTSIGEWAFSDCSGLTSVTIPSNVTSIRESAFYNCSGLTSITIPDSVTSIGNSAFSGCSGLTSVTIGNGVTSIGYSAFSYCSSLTSVTIPDSVTSIWSGVFYGTSIMNTYMTTKTMAQVQAMDNCPWGLPAGGIIHCSDDDFVVSESGGSGS